MAQMSFEENMNSRKVRQPLDYATSVHNSCGSEGTRVTIDRIKKMEKILALVDSPYKGEALAAARMVLRLIHAWGIDLKSLQFSSGDLVDNLLKMVAQSRSEHFFAPHTVPKNQEHNCPDAETCRRTIPTFVKAHLRRRRGGPPFPVKPHRRRRRGRSLSSTRGGWVRRESPGQFVH
ncbi:MAG: hypothetical protein ACLQPD_19135 [Desulfomonilaceae bacterium]